MSTQHSTSESHQSLPTQTDSSTQTNASTQTDRGAAPMMFSTQNEVPIKGLFKAESDEHDH